MLDWMFWLPQTAIAFAALVTMLAVLAVLDYYKRSSPRKGFLPMPTTRGDRVFIGLALFILIGILWLIFEPAPIYFALIPGIIVFIIIVKWG